MEDDERATGMRLALDTTRELHDKVRLTLASLRMKGARLPARLEPDAHALEAVRAKLQQLEVQLEEAWALPPGQLQRAAEVLCAVDETRGEVIDACSHFWPLVDSCQPLLGEVLSFCELGRGGEDGGPPPAPDFGATAADPAAAPGTAASVVAMVASDASPRPGAPAGEVTSARGAAQAGAKAPQQRLERDQGRAGPEAGEPAAVALEPAAAVPTRRPRAAAAAATDERRGTAPARSAPAASPAAAPAAAAAAVDPQLLQPRGRPLPMSERYARYAGVGDGDDRVLHGIDLAQDTVRRPKPSAADSALYGGKVSLQDYARGQAEGSDGSPRAAAPPGPKSRGPSAASAAARHAARRDTDRPADVGSSRELWAAAAKSGGGGGGASRMRVLQDAVTMSREDLQRLETRGRRRSWLAGAARAVAGAALAAALAAAGVVTVRTVVEEYRGGGGSCDTEDAQLEPLLPRFPSLRRATGGGDRGRGGTPFAPILPAPSPLDSRG